jgi:hypothetical protein
MDVSDSTRDDEWVSLLFRGERHPSNSFKWINIQLLKKNDVWDIAGREGLHTLEDLQLAIEQIEQILENENGALFEAATVTEKKSLQQWTTQHIGHGSTMGRTCHDASSCRRSQNHSLALSIGLS